MTWLLAVLKKAFMFAISEAASLMIVRVLSFAELKKRALPRGMSYKFSEAVMTMKLLYERIIGS